MFKQANSRKHVSEQSCSSVRLYLSILAHLARSFSLILNMINESMFWFQHANTRKHVSEQRWLSGWVDYVILAHLADLAQSYLVPLLVLTHFSETTIGSSTSGESLNDIFANLLLNLFPKNIIQSCFSRVKLLMQKISTEC